MTSFQRETNQTSPAPESNANESPSASILHVGKATLGRKNMGCTARKQDYMDAFSDIADIAVDRTVDCVLSTGRLFQSRSPDRATVSKLQSILERFQNADIPFYLVYGPKEVEATQTHIESLEKSGLITPIGGKVVRLNSGTVLIGIDAESSTDKQTSDDVEARDTLIIASGNTDIKAMGTDFEAIEAAVPTKPDLFLAGRRTDQTTTVRDGVEMRDPGSIEHVFSKTTLNEEPKPRGVNEYQVWDGAITTVRHELDSRDFATLEFDIDEKTTLKTLQNRLDSMNLSDKTVLARLVGDNESPSRKVVQDLLKERAHSARVYDERDQEESSETNREQRDSPTPDDTFESLVECSEEIQRRFERSEDLSTLAKPDLTDIYVLTSELRRAAESLREAIRDELAPHVQPDQRVTGTIGSVSGYKWTKREPRDRDVITDVLREQNVPVESVTTERVDSEKLGELVKDEETAIHESDVFEVTESETIKKAQFDLDGIESDNTENVSSGDERTDTDTYKIYLGNGVDIGGWIPVDATVVLDAIVPKVRKNQIESDEGDTVSVQFSCEVPINGWAEVDTTVVKDEIVPLIKQNRRDE